MKKIIIVAILFTLLTSCQSKCQEVTCIQPYDVEPEASLRVAVGSESYGQKLQALWQTIHPEINLSYQVVDKRSSFVYADPSFDLYYGHINYAIYHRDKFLILDDNLLTYTQFADISHFSSIININTPVFMPLDLEGMVMAYNQPKLQQLGIELTADSVITMESLLALDYQSVASEIMALGFNDKWSFYGFLTMAGWRLFNETDSTQHNFNDESFKAALQMIQQLGSKQYQEDKVAWHYEQALVQENSLLTLVGSWPQHQQLVSSQWQILPFPTYQSQNAAPLTHVFGYSINKQTAYPQAAKELLRVINSPQGIQLLVDDSTTMPLVSEHIMSQLTVSELKKQYLHALRQGGNEGLVALSNNQSKKAFDLYYEIDILPIVLAVYKQEISVEAAIQQIVGLADQWMEVNNGKTE